MVKEQIKWINCAKMVAILAVMTDHTFDVLYTNSKIAMASYFSVSLFIILSGMTSYLSYSKNNKRWKNIYKCGPIVFDYCIATFVYVVMGEQFFDLRRYFKLLFGFNAAGPLYYVLLYIQLMLVSQFLFNFINKNEEEKGKQFLHDALGLVAVIVMSIFTTGYTNILDVYGGGGRLLGGTYLILFYVGMLLMKHAVLEDTSLRKSLVTMIVFGVLWVVWWYYVMIPYRGVLDGWFPFGDGFNPPSISFMVSAFLMLFFLFGLFTTLQRFSVTKWFVDVMDKGGRYTLYIFLYHRFFLDFFLRRYVIIDNKWIRSLVYFGGMIAGSIMLSILKDKALKELRKIDQV